MRLLINTFILAAVGAITCLANNFLMRLFLVVAVMGLSFRIGVNFMEWEYGEDDVDNE